MSAVENAALGRRASAGEGHVDPYGRSCSLPGQRLLDGIPKRSRNPIRHNRMLIAFPPLLITRLDPRPRANRTRLHPDVARRRGRQRAAGDRYRGMPGRDRVGRRADRTSTWGPSRRFFAPLLGLIQAGIDVLESPASAACPASIIRSRPVSKTAGRFGCS
jgi:hypothetical protein